MVQAIDMPAVLNADHGTSDIARHRHSISRSTSPTQQARRSSESQSSPYTQAHVYERVVNPINSLIENWSEQPAFTNGSIKEGRTSQESSSSNAVNGTAGERTSGIKSTTWSTRARRRSGADNERRSGEATREGVSRAGFSEGISASNLVHSKQSESPRSPKTRPANGDVSSPVTNRTMSLAAPLTPVSALPPVQESSPGPISATTDSTLRLPAHGAHHHRASSPPAFSPHSAPPSSPFAVSPSPARPDRMVHRHTLEVPKVGTRLSQDSSAPPSAGLDPVGRFSPTGKRRGSLQLVRRATRSITSHPEGHPDEVPPDEDAARWAEHIKARRASKRAKADMDEGDVVVGTKVDENHQNFVRAYNMLTGIRFCVSRTNAKLDRELIAEDFETKNKYSFDITGSELTPSAKYDFKFKDYAPWVFRHLRARFQIDPAEYLMSLTSKYILSELGSPGKSGSFFYFSRDYKYIIKTIHHGEHKFLRKILREYHDHVLENPNTLISQFYGLHRVKMPYGKKVHFVVMNNLFPPHRDIHRTFDLKGSTIGRDFKEEDLEKNPRATLKDLNWLRRNLHLEFGPTKKDLFVAQMQRDVALLQRLKIMDYSLLVGIHDLGRGNEENLRDKTLQVFQPGGDKPEESQPGALMRTPSKMENAKRAKELRATVKKERPVPVSETLDKMPLEVNKRGSCFYADDGGFQATHENDVRGEEIYYLGIIDCLTRYNLIKRAEHFWKGMGGHESQISPVPPERYGDRFVKFISGITMSREQAEKDRIAHTLEAAAGLIIPAGIAGTVDDPRLGEINRVVAQDTRNPPGTENVMEKAEHQADKSIEKGANENDVPDRQIATIQRFSSEGDAATLPVIGEHIEKAGDVYQFPSHPPSREDLLSATRMMIGNANVPSESIGEVPPPTPPKIDGPIPAQEVVDREGWGGRPPPTPPKDEIRGRSEKSLPSLPPPATADFCQSPVRMAEEEMERARRKVEHAEELS